MNKQSAAPHAFEIEVPTGTGLEVLRTRLAIERTMAAWMRTVILFVAFGFTIVEFFQRVAFAEKYVSCFGRRRRASSDLP